MTFELWVFLMMAQKCLQIFLRVAQVLMKFSVLCWLFYLQQQTVIASRLAVLRWSSCFWSERWKKSRRFTNFEILFARNHRACMRLFETWRMWKGSFIIRQAIIVIFSPFIFKSTYMEHSLVELSMAHWVSVSDKIPLHSSNHSRFLNFKAFSSGVDDFN